MKILIAPQSFKGGISAWEAAQAIARGVVKAEPEAETVLVPVADGGDGTLETLIDSTGGQIFRSIVTGPAGHAVEASWGVMGDGETAVIEMARASGLALLPLKRRQEVMDVHIALGHKYPSVKINTSYSFGLDDQDFVVSFESDHPEDFLDLVMDLRETESSLYTVRDTPTPANPDECY